MTSPYPHPSPQSAVGWHLCLPERPRSPTYQRKEAPRWRGRVREELSKVSTAHAVPVDAVKLAPPLRWGCDGDHKMRFFAKCCTRPGRFTRDASLDHLVRGGLQRQRNDQAERLRSLEVDHQLEFGGLLDRQVGWCRALENPGDVGAGLDVIGDRIAAVADQPAGLGKLARIVD